jgi:hypothetical protein
VKQVKGIDYHLPGVEFSQYVLIGQHLCKLHGKNTTY